MPNAAMARPSHAPSVTGSPSAPLPAVCRLAVVDVVDVEPDTVTVLTASPLPGEVGSAESLVIVEVTGMEPLKNVVSRKVDVSGAAVVAESELLLDVGIELLELPTVLELETTDVLDVPSVVGITLGRVVVAKVMLLT